MAFWPVVVIVAGFIGTWYSISDKVEAMEPVKKKVEKLDENMRSIEKNQDELKKQLEIKAIQDKAAREKINMKLNQILGYVQKRPIDPMPSENRGDTE